MIAEQYALPLFPCGFGTDIDNLSNKHSSCSVGHQGALHRFGLIAVTQHRQLDGLRPESAKG
jgi:hypothetical protein